MDSHSKNVCLIGILHFFFDLIFSIDPLMEAYNSTTHPSFDDYFALGGYLVLMASLAALMILGVIKRNHKLLCPFLVMLILFLLNEILLFLEDLKFGFAFYSYEKRCYRIGIATISAYPIYTLYSKLRMQYLKKETLNDMSEEEKKKTAGALKQQLVV